MENKGDFFVIGLEIKKNAALFTWTPLSSAEYDA